MLAMMPSKSHVYRMLDKRLFHWISILCTVICAYPRINIKFVGLINWHFSCTALIFRGSTNWKSNTKSSFSPKNKNSSIHNEPTKIGNSIYILVRLEFSNELNKTIWSFNKEKFINLWVQLGMCACRPLSKWVSLRF